MKIHLSKWALLLGILALNAQLSAFAEGTAFTYQGQLKEAGVPVNAPVNFVFGLWDAPAAGNQIGAPVALNAIAVSNGLFTVQLDFGANGFTGSARWLEIAVNGNALAPRQAVTPVPMALYALTPTGPEGPVGATGPQGSTGATGSPGPQGLAGPQGLTGSTGPQGTAGPSGAIGATGSQGPPGTAGPQGPSGAFTLAGDTASYVGGNVGIGTTIPLNPFHVRVATNMNLGIRSYQGSAAIGAFNDAGNLAAPINFDASKFTFTSGNVGIGTTEPSSKLEVRGDIRMGPIGEDFATRSEESLRIVRGLVRADGSAVDGRGFWVNHPATGRYDITFTTPFIGIAPVVTVTASTGSIGVIASISAPTANSVTVYLWSQGQGVVDNAFHFIAIGWR